jgi:hypothetical protein
MGTEHNDTKDNATGQFNNVLLNVSKQPIKISVIMLGVIMLGVIMLSALMLTALC